MYFHESVLLTVIVLASEDDEMLYKIGPTCQLLSTKINEHFIEKSVKKLSAKI